jgi:copper(I)-binding protein
VKRSTLGVGVGLGVVALVAVAGVAMTSTGTPSQSSNTVVSGPSGLLFTNVTVTAASTQGESAVAMTIHNNTSGPISLMNVASPLSSMNMLYYDTNMCQGNTAMTWLANIFISQNQIQLLGYQNQGVMLARLHQNLKVGTVVPLQVKYSNFSTSHVVTVQARVVAPPKGLHFHLSVMKM